MIDDNKFEKIPEKIKIDLDTPLEIFFMVIFCFVCGGVIITAVMAFTSYTDGKADNYANSALMGLIILALFILKCRRETDNFYIVDTAGRKLLYHYQFFSEVKITPVAGFDDIKCIAVGGTCSVNKGAENWLYHIYMIDKNGELTLLSNQFAELAIMENNRKCRGIAEVIGCECVEGSARRALDISRDAGGGISVALAERGTTGSSMLKNAPSKLKNAVIIFLIFDFILTAAIIAFVIFRMRQQMP